MITEELGYEIICDLYPLLTPEPYLGELEKHAEHDQSTHGNWAGNNFKENTHLGRLSQSFQEQGLGNAVDKYSATFGIDKDGNYFGTNAFEANAVLTYTGAGYEDINYFARGFNRGALFISEDEATDTVYGNLKFFDEAMENYGPLLSESNSERTLEQEMEAIQSYARSSEGNIKLLEAFREGKSPRGATANRNIDHLDKVIANSPDVFGGTTLYRVFSDKVLENLKEGDILRDKGFLSTTRANITEPDNSNIRSTLGGINPSPDTVGVIRPSPSKKGKGLAVDLYKAIVNEPMGPSLAEKEVLLPRNTSLRFLGYETNNNNTTGPQIAIFERVD